MLKNIIGGIAVGVANIIPGVSGGTMLVILGLFDKLTNSISEIFKIRSDKRKESIKFLVQVLIGAAIGLIGFAKVIDWLFGNWPTQTFYWFIGLIILSIPSLLKKELKGNKISWISFVIGMFIIFTISYLNPGKQELTVSVFPDITILYLISLIFVGMISGATMILPGVSGSLVLLVIGKYYIFKSYLANVTSFEMDVIIPLIFIAVGVVLGILLSAKVTSYLLKNNRRQTVSFILGLIVASAFILIPIDVNYNLPIIVTSIISFAVGALVVYIIDRQDF